MSIDDDGGNSGDEIDSLKHNSSEEVDESGAPATVGSVNKITEQIEGTIQNIKDKAAYIEDSFNEDSCVVLQFQPRPPSE